MKGKKLVATKDPWNNELYQAMREDSDDLKRKTRGKNNGRKPLTTRFLTFLLAVMFVLLGLALIFIFYNNQMSTNKTISTFASSKTAASKSSVSSTQQKSSSQSTSSSSSSSSSSSTAASTYTIVSGDTPNTIASKTGVSWATIASLNNISSSGYNADGSAIYPGQVLKLK